MIAWTICRFKGGGGRLGKKERVVLLRGVDTLMHIMSGTQFFRNTNGIQSRSDALDESRFVVNFLTILGVTEILCSFRLVLEGRYLSHKD